MRRRVMLDYAIRTGGRTARHPDKRQATPAKKLRRAASGSASVLILNP